MRDESQDDKKAEAKPDSSVNALIDELREEQGDHIGNAKEPVDVIVALSDTLSKEEFMRALVDTCDVEHDGTGYTPPKQVQRYLENVR